ncbi:hypothetical protein ACB092_10G044200 [Castanea dentata]
MATRCKEKAVLVTVYVERPRKRKVSTNHRQHHHHNHYLHHTTKRGVTQVNHGAHGPGNKGYDRRAQLLQYSKHLRESSQSATTTPLPLRPTSSSNQQPSTQIAAFQRKRKQDRAPACLGIWKILLPNFFRYLIFSKARKERKKKKHRGSKSNTLKEAGIYFKTVFNITKE